MFVIESISFKCKPKGGASGDYCKDLEIKMKIVDEDGNIVKKAKVTVDVERNDQFFQSFYKKSTNSKGEVKFKISNISPDLKKSQFEPATYDITIRDLVPKHQHSGKYWDDGPFWDGFTPTNGFTKEPQP